MGLFNQPFKIILYFIRLSLVLCCFNGTSAAVSVANKNSDALFWKRIEDCNTCFDAFQANICVSIFTTCETYHSEVDEALRKSLLEDAELYYGQLDCIVKLKETKMSSTYCQGFAQEAIHRPMKEPNRMCNMDIGSKLNMSNYYVANAVLDRLETVLKDDDMELLRIKEEYTGDDEVEIESEITYEVFLANRNLFQRPNTVEFSKQSSLSVEENSMKQGGGHRSYKVWMVYKKRVTNFTDKAIQKIVNRVINKYSNKEIMSNSVQVIQFDDWLVIKIMKPRDCDICKN